MNNRTWQPPELIPLVGTYVQLLPLVPERDTPQLYRISHGTPEKESLWTHLPYGPFADVAQMQLFLETELFGKVDPLIWIVVDPISQMAVGSVGLLAIVPDHGRAEIGHVWFTPAVQRTKINTETQFLLLVYLFDQLGYRRVEWKCNSLNHASRTTAARMGFTFEGRFRQHMLLKGLNRDTDWFAMTDKEWPQRKINFEKFLYSSEKLSLTALNNG